MNYIDYGDAGGCYNALPVPSKGAHLPAFWESFGAQCLPATGTGNLTIGFVWKAASGATFNPWPAIGYNNYPSIEYNATDIPQLYDTSSAGITPATTAEWLDLYWYGVKYRSTPLTFTGEMTQQGACQVVGGCTGTDAAPGAAWMSLWDGVDTLASNGHVSWSTADQMLMDTQFSEFGASTDVTWLQCSLGPPVCPFSS